jgi:hypothetical protein
LTPPRSDGGYLGKVKLEDLRQEFQEALKVSRPAR